RCRLRRGGAGRRRKAGLGRVHGRARPRARQRLCSGPRRRRGDRSGAVDFRAGRAPVAVAVRSVGPGGPHGRGRHGEAAVVSPAPAGAAGPAASSATPVSPMYRQFVLGLSTLAAVGSSVVHMGTPFLIPALTASGLSLPAAGLIAAMPAAGIVVTLSAWGWFVDVFGERAALSLGLGSTAAMTGVAAWASESGAVVLAGALFLAGCAAASVNSASGRVVSGWYPPSQRGTAMGIRQMAQPLGAALAAVTLPVLAANYGIRAALGFAAVLCAVLALACLLGIKDPPRPEVGSADHAAAKVSPYRGSRYLVRIHIASAMLSWPQSMMGSFILVWLIARGHSEVSAGVIVMIAQLSGAGSRAAMGFISDRARSRLRPYRHVATVTLVLSGAMALIDGFGAGWTAGTAGAAGVGGVAGVAGVAGL